MQQSCKFKKNHKAVYFPKNQTKKKKMFMSEELIFLQFFFYQYYIGTQLSVWCCNEYQKKIKFKEKGWLCLVASLVSAHIWSISAVCDLAVPHGRQPIAEVAAYLMVAGK